ncbi:hypothetical protein KEM48_005427 [Puccinia striiformis f. sp. tritici PST-130]|uniref:Transcription factor CBF/NF-Y/archaeal histone domain-containing protein n=1 Tax=Puccinia striiformis TaxID=27350 RepID=A0A2S4VQ60_9BASI|nr:hypothetical protein Pst134EB_028409 [Puccinia striiformis f. sp. tritici]KAI9616168.1 hypothetical protein KEM48_005427 [Puccinia striiformis f. sp. tritici PST-130]POW11633.1 hypothetical protein PSTT_05147 [Puccinia striiformis]
MPSTSSQANPATTTTATTATTTTPASLFVPRPTTTTQTFLPEFWSHIIRNAEEYQSDFKDGQLPLARIKKLVKSDPDVKMIANEVTVLLDKACEIFINEITVRAFLVANSLNRRTVSTSDVAMAISQSDMFDFLIDIVPQLSQDADPTANLPPCPSTSTSPTTVPKNSSAASRQRRPTLPEVPEDTENQTEPIVSTPLPSAPPPPPPKKRPRNTRVNRNLLPEEVAVPIPDTELLKEEPSPEHPSRRPPHVSLLAVPIPDYELIPPRPSGSTWELAVPITTNGQQSLIPDSELIPPRLSGSTWELAVPITSNGQQSSQPAPASRRAWEMAVPISDSSSSLHQRGDRNWELAVPISDNLDQTALHPSHNKRKRNWDLAVPIVDETSRQAGQMTSNDPGSSHHSGRSAAVPIDPTLFDLESSAKLTSASIDPHHLTSPSNPTNITIKPEE